MDAHCALQESIPLLRFSPCFPLGLLPYKPGFCYPTLPYRRWALALMALSPRMPAILDGDEAIRKWLDFAEVPTQEAVKLIQPTENIVFHPVSTFVNSVRNNTPECLAPIELGAKKVSAGGGWAGDSLAPVPSLSGDSSRQRLQGMPVLGAGVQSPEQIPFPPLPEINCHPVPGFLCQMRQIPCEMGLRTSPFSATQGTSCGCA